MTVRTGETVPFNCKHRFGWAYAWVTSRGSISTLGNKVSDGIFLQELDNNSQLATFIPNIILYRLASVEMQEKFVLALYITLTISWKSHALFIQWIGTIFLFHNQQFYK